MLSRFFIHRPIFAAVLSIVIIISGLVTLRSLPIAQYPEIAPPTVQVRAVYPGASSAVLADTVAQPIEEQVNGAEVFRSNLPPGPLSPSTLASATQNDDDESRFVVAEVSGAMLVRGENVVAVAVHQASATSSDASFDLGLKTGAPVVEPHPVFRGRVVDAETGEQSPESGPPGRPAGA